MVLTSSVKRKITCGDLMVKFGRKGHKAQGSWKLDVRDVSKNADRE
jgi:subtilisin-like proprotein convertase family protein